MKILVTGANGYLGQGIVKKILDYGHEVIAADLKLDCVDDRAIKIPCNIFDLNEEELIEKFEGLDALLHLAWRDGFFHYSKAHIVDLPKHFEFICKIIESQKGIKKIAVMGSMHEVGFFEGCVRENTPCHPTTPYGISKNALRYLVEMLTKEKNILFQWLRGYYIVGSSTRGGSIFSKIAAAAEKGEKQFPFTLGQNQYDFVDYDMFCTKTASAVCQNRINGIIDICSGKPEKLADRVERFIKENNYDLTLCYGIFPDRSYDSKAIWGSSEKIDKIMNEYMFEAFDD